MTWIFEPYRIARRTGQLVERDSAVFRGIIDAVGERIARHVIGRGEKRTIDLRYEVIGGGPGWKMIHEIGDHGRIAAFAEGVQAYAVAKPNGEGKRFSYTIGRTSTFVPFDIPAICAELNAVEGKWGGGNLVIGPDRVLGSGIKPTNLERIINQCGPQVRAG